MAGKKRTANQARKTNETDIKLSLNIDGSGKVSVKTGIGFFDHMVTSMCKHALFDLTATAKGDVEVDDHHSVEDFGLVLGEALNEAVGDKKGITRFGQSMVPMDDAMATAVVDFSGRPYLVYNVLFSQRDKWEFDLNLVKEFFQALCSTAKINLHLRLEYGKNYHHGAEAVFKSAGRAMREALQPDPRVKGVPSTKGTL